MGALRSARGIALERRRVITAKAKASRHNVPIGLTQQEFDGLLEYSASMPTGMIIGKRWKRNCAIWERAYHEIDNIAQKEGVCREEVAKRYGYPFKEWWMLEYAEHEDPERVYIIWRPIYII